MPTYEYACRDCGEHLEVVQSFRDEPLTTCGQCSGQLRKVFSPAGIIFKGSGFYVTDSRSDSSATTGSAKSDGAAKSDDKADASASSSESSSSDSSGSDSSSSDSSTSSSSDSESAA